MLNTPVRLPETKGVKVTLILQFAPFASEVGQLLVCAKLPFTEIPEIFKGTSPELFKFTALDPLVVFTSWLEKLNEVAERLATGATPAPVKLADGALPTALLFKVNVPVLFPRAVGVKTMYTEQLAPAARVPPQLLLWLKSPVSVKPLMDSGPTPVLVNVCVCEVLDVFTSCEAKVSEEGENAPFGEIPTPERLTVCGLPPKASSAMVTIPVRLPVAVGLNVTLIEQLAPPARVVPQLLVCEKSPLEEIPEILSVASPVLVSVTDDGALVVFTI